MHRVIISGIEGLHVDHKDQNSLNNRRYNLRPATTSQNGFNRPVQADSASGLKGVHRDKRYTSSYTANIKTKGKATHLGGNNIVD